MIILAVDTSTPILAVSICANQQILAEAVVECGRAHSERLLGSIDWILHSAGLTLKDVKLLAVSIGPGSFTGLRVGIAAMKGLALGTGLPLAGVPTLDAMTRLGAFQDGRVCPMLDAKMGEVFGAIYDFSRGERNKLKPEYVGSVEALLADVPGPLTVFGEGAQVYRDRILAAAPDARVLSDSFNAMRGSAVAAEALGMVEMGADTDAARVKPIYLRKAKVDLSAKTRGRKAAAT